jgi:hypothetical protein
MAKPTGPLVRPRRRRIIRTRRRFGWGWIRRLPLLWIGAVVVCAFLVYFFAGSGIFSVRTVMADHLAPGDVARITRQCGCVGDNIFMVRSDEIKRRLAAIPTLRIGRVYTRLPNQVIVEATYKRKVAIWRTPEAAYGVDADGEVLQVWKRPFPHWGPMGLPVFDEGYDSTIKRGKRLLVGQSIAVEPLTMALNVRSRLPASLVPLVKGYLYRPFVGITIIGRANWWALVGLDYSSNLDVRLSTLEAALEQVPPYIGPGDCVDLRSEQQYYRHDHHCGY